MLMYKILILNVLMCCKERDYEKSCLFEFIVTAKSTDVLLRQLRNFIEVLTVIQKSVIREKNMRGDVSY